MLHEFDPCFVKDKVVVLYIGSPSDPENELEEYNGSSEDRRKWKGCLPYRFLEKAVHQLEECGPCIFILSLPVEFSDQESTLILVFVLLLVLFLLLCAMFLSASVFASLYFLFSSFLFSVACSILVVELSFSLSLVPFLFIFLISCVDFCILL